MQLQGRSPLKQCNLYESVWESLWISASWLPCHVKMNTTQINFSKIQSIRKRFCVSCWYKGCVIHQRRMPDFFSPILFSYHGTFDDTWVTLRRVRNTVDLWQWHGLPAKHFVIMPLEMKSERYTGRNSLKISIFVSWGLLQYYAYIRGSLKIISRPSNADYQKIVVSKVIHNHLLVSWMSKNIHEFILDKNTITVIPTQRANGELASSWCVQ